MNQPDKLVQVIWESKSMSRDINLSDIKPNEHQPRKRFNDIEKLAESMREHGLMQPIMLTPDGMIIHGERRYRAALSLGWETIAANVSNATPEEIPFLVLVENLQREDLTPLEEARAYQELVNEGYKQTEIAKRIGKTQSYIAQKIRLLRMPDYMQQHVNLGLLTEGHCRQLMRLRSDRHMLYFSTTSIILDESVAKLKVCIDVAITWDDIMATSDKIETMDIETVTGLAERAGTLQRMLQERALRSDRAVGIALQQVAA